MLGLEKLDVYRQVPELVVIAAPIVTPLAAGQGALAVQLR